MTTTMEIGKIVAITMGNAVGNVESVPVKNNSTMSISYFSSFKCTNGQLLCNMQVGIIVRVQQDLLTSVCH